MNAEIRVFPRRTNATPDDPLAFVGYPPLPNMRPETGDVRVSCTFTWDIVLAEKLARAWGEVYPNVTIGGPAFDDPGGSFVPGRFLADGYEKGDFDSVVMFYTKFKSAMATTALQVQLLPFESADGEEEGGASALYIFEPTAEELMEKLLPKYLQNQIYLAFVEAAASEHGNRMVSMRNATDNADEMIRTLTLSYNKMRQASITGELLEVVAGADATKKE